MSEKKDWLSSTQNTALILCPYFRAHGDQEIKCEGIIDNTSTKSTFSGKTEKKWHQETFCENQYQKCEIYCSIKHWKWPDDE